APRPVNFCIHPAGRPINTSIKVLRRPVESAQFSSSDWQSFLKANNVVSSMSRRGNCHDNAVAESFFQLLKRERVRRKTYATRDEARSDIFDYIEMFYNPKRRHSSAMQLSPVEYAKRYFLSLGMSNKPGAIHA
ncbi:IS3 family transposase, partial [Pseudomonas sp. NGC7]|uniref:IS3 family transposase n=1 Tax=Pseudomonas sp. NGC7 TaxID=3341775 RepID=UPI00399C5C16